MQKAVKYMKKFLSLAAAMLMLLTMLPALADSIPMYEVFPATPDGRIWIEVPNQYDFIPVGREYAIGYIFDASTANASEGERIAHMGILAHVPEGYEPTPNEPEFSDFAVDGKAVLGGAEQTEFCTVIERYTINDFPAVRVDMTGQNYEMIWIGDGADMYFFMYPLVDEAFAQMVREAAETFHLLDPLTPARCDAADYEYSVSDSGVTITRYRGDAVRVAVPSEIEGQPVVALGDKAFYETPVTWVSIPDSVETIGKSCFGGCMQLQTLHLPEGLKEIPDGMLESCCRLLALDIPDGVTRIGAGALWGNFYLIELRLPAALNTIAGGNFVMAEQLQGFIVPEGNTAFKTMDNGAVLLSADGKRFIHYCPWQERTSYTIPEGVEQIDAFAFCDWYSLTEVTVPEGVVTIEGTAFISARSLRTLTLPMSATDLGMIHSDMGDMNIVPVEGGEGMNPGEGATAIAGEVTIIAPEDSAAQRHAEQFHMTFKAAPAADEILQE